MPFTQVFDRRNPTVPSRMAMAESRFQGAGGGWGETPYLPRRGVGQKPANKKGRSEDEMI